MPDMLDDAMARYMAEQEAAKRSPLLSAGYVTDAMRAASPYARQLDFTGKYVPPEATDRRDDAWLKPTTRAAIGGVLDPFGIPSAILNNVPDLSEYGFPGGAGAGQNLAARLREERGLNPSAANDASWFLAGAAPLAGMQAKKMAETENRWRQLAKTDAGADWMRQLFAAPFALASGAWGTASGRLWGLNEDEWGARRPTRAQSRYPSDGQ